ncbi:hypothetical protein C8J48_0489 [Desmospora activa DSM 45169]|uniref:Uncharacterized protein n=1 Tax=Desmospora activa DSM 45169 TaxID=1121389 RepID=A0A2T4Z7Q2_9BACL|nr:hypothetical protein C8J48_0489 [Desmospora activa DSM 45169]
MVNTLSGPKGYALHTYQEKKKSLYTTGYKD